MAYTAYNGTLRATKMFASLSYKFTNQHSKWSESIKITLHICKHFFYIGRLFLYYSYFFNMTSSVDGFAEPYNLGKS